MGNIVFFFKSLFLFWLFGGHHPNKSLTTNRSLRKKIIAKRKIMKRKISDSIAELAYVHNQWYRMVAKFIKNIPVVMSLLNLLLFVPLILMDS